MLSMHSFYKAGLQGAFSSVGSIYFFGMPARANMFGINIPLYAILGSGGIISSYLADLLHVMIKSEIPHNKKLQDETSMVLGMALSAGILYDAISLSNPDLPSVFGIYRIMGICIVSEITGQILAD